MAPIWKHDRVLFKKHPTSPIQNLPRHFFVWRNIINHERAASHELQWFVSPVRAREHVFPVRDKEFFSYLSWEFPAWFGTVNLSSNAADWNVLQIKRKERMTFFFIWNIQRKRPFPPTALSSSLPQCQLWVLHGLSNVIFEDLGLEETQASSLLCPRVTSFKRNINLCCVVITDATLTKRRRVHSWMVCNLCWQSSNTLL